MWEGHLGSKAHRVAVANEKARLEASERRKEAETTQKVKGKRKVEDSMDIDSDMTNVQESNGTIKKLRKSEEPDRPPASGFPADFFSDPSRVPVLENNEDNADEDEQPAQPAPAPQSQLDREWEEFQASLLAQNSNKGDEEEDKMMVFDRATLAAEPELVETNGEGFPESIVPGIESGETVQNGGVEETEEEKKRRKEQEERELIMDRLIEEVSVHVTLSSASLNLFYLQERAQEEADERVGLLKSRIEALKKARQDRKKAAW